jgi:hypothetical protein
MPDGRLFRSCLDQFYSRLALLQQCSWYMPVQSRQSATVMKGLAEEVDICRLVIADNRVWWEQVSHADIRPPESVIVKRTELPEKVRDSGRIAGPVWVRWVAGNSNVRVLRNRTGCPGKSARFGKPLMRRFMMDMHRVTKGEENVHIQQVRCHGVSSRSPLTSSRVTISPSGRFGNRGIPLRVSLSIWRVSACRANSEST